MNICQAYNTADRPRAIEWLEQCKRWNALAKHTLYLLPAFDCPPIPEIVPFVGLTDYLQISSNWRSADGVKHADAAGPNSVLRTFARHFYDNKLGPWFFIEPDCIVLKPDSFDKWEAEYLACGRPYMGGFAPAPVPHINGNMTLPQNAALLTTLMLPMRSDDGTRDIAFDVAAAREILPQAHATDLMQHLWRGPSFTSQEDFDARIRKDALFFHQCRDGSIYQYIEGRDKRKEGDETLTSTRATEHSQTTTGSNGSEPVQTSIEPTLTERRQAQAAKMRAALAAKRATGWKPKKHGKAKRRKARKC